MNLSNGPVAFLIIGSIIASFFFVAWLNSKWEAYLGRQRTSKNYGRPPEPEKKNPFPKVMGIAAVVLVIGLVVLIASPSGGLIRYCSYFLCIAPLGLIVCCAFVYLGGLHEEAKHEAARKRLEEDRHRDDQ